MKSIEKENSARFKMYKIEKFAQKDENLGFVRNFLKTQRQFPT